MCGTRSPDRVMVFANVKGSLRAGSGHICLEITWESAECSPGLMNLHSAGLYIYIYIYLL